MKEPNYILKFRRMFRRNLKSKRVYSNGEHLIKRKKTARFTL